MVKGRTPYTRRINGFFAVLAIILGIVNILFAVFSAPTWNEVGLASLIRIPFGVIGMFFIVLGILRLIIKD